MTCAVPDLPLSSIPASLNWLPVPPLSLMTPYMASVIFSTVRSEIGNRSSPTLSASFSMWGCLKTPPMATPPIIRASCSGVVWTKGGEILRGNMVLQHRRGCHNFENRSWRKLRLNRAIEQRLLPVLVEILPVIRRDAHGEIVGVQCGMAGHR